MRKVFEPVAHATILCVLLVTLATSVAAQGKGHGGAVGGGRGSSGNSDRQGNDSDRSRGRSDDSFENGSMRSNRRSDDRMERAERAKENMQDADNDLRDHPGVPRTLHVPANSLRSAFQAALLKNPDLTFGHFVAATRLAQNLGGRFPNITRDNILAGLASGKSLGRTLHDLGLSDQETKDARKHVDEEIKQAKKMKS